MIPLNQLRRVVQIVCTISVFLMSSCMRDANKVIVEHLNFNEEVQTGQNLIFTFDRDLCPDSLLGKPDSSNYINFTPAVKGIYRWNNPRELMFIPENGFAPCSEYQIKLQDKIAKIHPSGRYYMGDDAVYKFHTPFPGIELVNGYWEAQGQDIGLVAEMILNMQADPKVLAAHLKISGNKGPVNFEIITQEASKTIRIRIPQMSPDLNKEELLQFVLTKGMTWSESNYKTSKDISYELKVTPPGTLQIVSANGIFDDAGAALEVITNQPVSEEQVKQYVKVANTEMSYQVSLLPNGFRLTGPFNDYTTYQLFISKDIQGMAGGKMQEDYTQDIEFMRQQSSIKFADAGGMYIGSNGMRNIALNVVNIKKVRVKLYKIYENNLNFFLYNKRYTSYNQQGKVTGFSFYTWDLEKMGSLVSEGEYQTNDLKRYGNQRILHLGTDQIKNYKGVYLYVVESADQEVYASDAKLVAVSDVGIISRRTEDEVYVFANSISSAEPLRNVKVKLISTNNQVMAEQSTDAEGVAIFRGITKMVPKFEPGMITVTRDNDFGFMLFADAEVQQSRFDIDGYRNNAAGIQAFIYGDRDMYRPGETIHTRYILRNQLWETPAGYPVKIKVINPNGQELKQVMQRLSETGSTGLDISLPQSALTGTYTFEIYTASDLMLGNYRVSVEEFMPDRIDLKAQLNQSSYKLTDSIRGTLNAKNFFGPPAAGRKYEYEFSLSYKHFAVKGLEDYNFDVVHNHHLDINKDVYTGVTDASGNAPIKWTLPSGISGSGLLQGMLYATVFDETGRPVHRSAPFDLYTQNVFFGVKQSDFWYSSTDKIIFPLKAVSASGAAVSATARVKLVQVEWFSWMTEGPEGYGVRSNGKERVISDQMVQIGLQGLNYNVMPGTSGEFELRIYAPGSEKYTSAYFSAWGWGNASNNSFEVNKEGTVTIQANKKNYTLGEEASLLFKTPFSGNMLVTVERDKLIEYHYVKVQNKSASLNIKLKEGFCPNVYISATLFHPASGSEMPLTVAHGCISLPIEQPGLKIPVDILVAENSRSGKRQTIKVKTTSGMGGELTLAVVDEGILSIRGYETPNPYSYFYQKRALTVSNYDMYPFLMPEIGGKKSQTGGDGFAAKMDANKDRANPLANNRINLIAFWSGPIKLNAAGEGTWNIDIPKFSGRLRVMAVVHKGKSFGASEKPMTISDPVVLSPAIPRFLSPGDTASIPLVLTNTTKNGIQGNAKIIVSGNLQIIGAASGTIYLKPGAEERVIYKVISRGKGQGQIQTKFESNQETYSVSTDITVRPSGGLQVTSESGYIKAGNSKELKSDESYIPQWTTRKLYISKSPMAQFAKNLDYLIRYPYGCVEQTTSAVFPQLYMAELYDALKMNKGQAAASAGYVQEAIRKLSGMQLYNGAFSYWSGESYESYWGSIYATHFLIEANRAGYEVNPTVINKALAYMDGKLRFKETLTRRIYLNNKWVEQNIYLPEYAYSVYVLALGGKPDRATMNQLKSSTQLLSGEGRFLLAAAYAVIGDMNTYKILTNTTPTGHFEDEFGGSFYSHIRESALILNVMCERDPNNPKIDQLVRDLSEELQGAYLNTQEQSWAMLALGKYLKRRNPDFAGKAEIKVDGKLYKTFEGKDLMIEVKGGQSLSVSTTGKGNLFYFYESRGISTIAPAGATDHKLVVRRSWYTRDGRSISGNTFKQNDLIVVKVTIQTEENRYVENIALTDMLPAGFEIENPRISAVPDVDWISNPDNPDYIDMRDDRITFFTSADRRQRNFYYLVRCVSPGNYTLGPVEGDAMYRAEYHSSSGSGRIIIKP